MSPSATSCRFGIIRCSINHYKLFFTRYLELLQCASKVAPFFKFGKRSAFKRQNMENNIVLWLSEQGISAANVMQVLFSLMISILFIQSGLDKVFNWAGDRDFYKSHFKDTILDGTVSLLMPVITLSELAAGFLSGAGLLALLFTGQTGIGLLGMLMACLSIIQLFLGQRVAKDYAGAAVLVPYFLMAAAGVYFFLLG